MAGRCADDCSLAEREYCLTGRAQSWNPGDREFASSKIDEA